MALGYMHRFLLFASCRLFMASLVFSGQAIAQQTFQHTQYTFNGLAVNPAYAGYTEEWTGRLSYRLQWAGLTGHPRTGTASFDGLLDHRKKTIGLGLLVSNDQLGPQMQSEVRANLSYRIRLDEEDTKRLCFGISAGVSQYSLDASEFVATDIFDVALPSGDNGRLIPQFGAGVYYCSSSFYYGFSAVNLLAAPATPATAVARPTRHFYLTAGALFSAGALVDLKPSLLVKEDLNGPTSLDLSNYIALKKMVWLGVSYRSAVKLWRKKNLQPDLDKRDALAALAQIFWKSRFRLGYSYDFSTSELSGFQSGSHEISLSISLPAKKERIMSPRFF